MTPGSTERLICEIQESMEEAVLALADGRLPEHDRLAMEIAQRGLEQHGGSYAEAAATLRTASRQLARLIDEERLCEHCTRPLPPGKRSDARFCRDACKTAAHRRNACDASPRRGHAR